MNQEVIDYCKTLAPMYFSHNRDKLSAKLTLRGITDLGGVSRIVYRDEKGILSNSYKEGACHAFLGYPDNAVVRSNSEAVVTLVMPFKGEHKHQWSSEASLLTYCHWLANESPVAYMCVNKDPEEILNKGLILDANVPGSHLLFACLLSRVPHEFHKRTNGIKVLEALINGGVNTLLALGVAYSISGPFFHLTNSCDGHSPLNIYNRGRGDLKRIVEGKMRETSPTLYPKATGSLSGVFALFNGVQDTNWASEFQKKLNLVLVGMNRPHPANFSSTPIPYPSEVLSEGQLTNLVNFLLLFQEDVVKDDCTDSWLDWKQPLNRR